MRAEAGPVRAWELASVAFFAYVGIAAIVMSGIDRATRLRILGGVFLGLALVSASVALPPSHFARVWMLPPLLLLCGYWISGGLFVAPMPSMERQLERVDAVLKIDRIAAKAPRIVAELVEFAYSGVYPLIPLALYIALRHGGRADRFWSVVLITDYICFACLPWIQTRPPRAFREKAPWQSAWRRINLRLLGTTSIQVNTFPSGHAAEALAAALLVSAAPAWIQAWMFLNAAAISAGAVFGRYHYASDAIAGWAVALVVWIVI